MQGIDRNTLTDAVVASFEGADEPRMKEVIGALVRHLHAFAREVDLRPEEWRAGIAFLTAAAAITDDKRNEFVLASDILGLTSLTDLLQGVPGATERSVLGPFHAEGSPMLPVGGDLIRDNAGPPVLVRGRVLDLEGRPVRGATIDFWQTNALGHYWQQDPTQSPDNLRFRMPLGDDGVYAFTTVRPAPYTVPYDGPVGGLLRAGGRHAWRPAHFHFRVLADGFAPLTTELFPADDPYIEQDAVFGVRASLAVPFVTRDAPEEAARHRLPNPFALVEFDFRMSPAR
ncbi:MAG: dioxygenase [Pseudomonadota bacterium]